MLRFTLAETLKSRANVISCVILLLFALAAYPMIVLTGGADTGTLQPPETTGTAIVTLANQTTLPLDASRIGVSDIPGLTGEIGLQRVAKGRRRVCDNPIAADYL